MSTPHGLLGLERYNGPARTGPEPQCSRSWRCATYDQGFGELPRIVSAHTGLCVRCTLEELRRVIDCVTPENEESDQSALDVLAETLKSAHVEFDIEMAIRRMGARHV